MGDISIRGRSPLLKGGRARLWHGGSHNTGRTNLLEQLGRVEGERSNPNRRAEISRVHGELNRGYKDGGRIKAQNGKFITKKDKEKTQWITKKPKYITRKEKPKAYITRKEEPKAWITKKDFKTHGRDVPTMAAEGGRIGLRQGSKRFVKGTKREKQISMATDRPTEGTKLILRKGTKPYTPEGEKVGKRIELKKGGSDKKWMQKVSASIKKRGTKGKCTPITKPGCTGRAKALAKTFKKIAAKRKA